MRKKIDAHFKSDSKFAGIILIDESRIDIEPSEVKKDAALRHSPDL